MTQAAPDMIGGVPTPPFVFLPDLGTLFRARAARCRALAEGHAAASFLLFLAQVIDAQATLATTLGPAAPPDAERLAQLSGAGMPPIDRAVLAGDPAAQAALDGLLALLRDVPLPPPAALARDALGAASAAQRAEVLAAVLADRYPQDAIAAHVLAAAAMQVELARRAAALDPATLSPVATGICPACGGRPAASVVTASMEVLEGTRYACCAGCSTRWNEVRVKCLGCGSMQGVTYRNLEDGGTAEHEAPIRAECCNDCGAWVKILYQLRLPHLEVLADDVASLGLDLRMQGGRWHRAGANPFLAGY